MKILICHNYYQQRGGEDCIFEEERDLLRDAGHEVLEYQRHNDELESQSWFRIGKQMLWNRQAVTDVRDLIEKHRPDVFHATNTFPLVSPAVLHTAHAQGVAVVQDLQNYRLICPGSYLMRNDKPCHDCVGKTVPWQAVLHRCYRDSFLASCGVSSMVTLHRLLGTWRDKVDLFYTPSQFARQQFLSAGFPADRVAVKYNMVSPAPPVGSGRGDYLVFVGRLSPEKGISSMLESWKQDTALPPLKIVGDGPLAAEVERSVAQDSRIEWLGYRSLTEVHRIVGEARALLMPSVWYETFGRTTTEAFASGTPVIASNLGAMQELVVENQTGLLFEPGNPISLRDRIHQFLGMTEDQHKQLRHNARSQFEQRFTSEQNLTRILEIYQLARERAASRTTKRPLPAHQRDIVQDEVAPEEVSSLV